MRMIVQSVGREGANIPTDVQLVQTLLNKSIKQLELRPLRVDGQLGPRTLGAIEAFQSRVVGMDPADGRVDPSGRTLKALVNAKSSATSHARVPLGSRQAEKPTPKWMSVAAGEANWFGIATQEEGQAELPGSDANNPKILQYLRTVPHLMTARVAPGIVAGQIDETAWCGCFVNWCLIQAGLPPYPKSMAKDWTSYGRALDAPVPGAITVVYKKPKDSTDKKTTRSGYHVAFYVSGSGSTLTLFGGNQGDKVCEKNFAGWKLEGYRWPL